MEDSLCLAGNTVGISFAAEIYRGNTVRMFCWLYAGCRLVGGKNAYSGEDGGVVYGDAVLVSAFSGLKPRNVHAQPSFSAGPENVKSKKFREKQKKTMLQSDIGVNAGANNGLAKNREKTKKPHPKIETANANSTGRDDFLSFNFLSFF